MFTGIILGLGVVENIIKHGPDATLSLRAKFALPDLVDGESMAVNGVCLSLESHRGNQFTVYASAETLARTTLTQLVVGKTVNLERALAIGDRLGGHIVSGHVDGVATIIATNICGKSRQIRFSYPRELAPELMPKGSVALDGISLTINACTEEYFEVNLIPDTQERTNCASWQVGVKVNLETDVLGKYVRNILKKDQDVCALKLLQEKQEPKKQELTAQFLQSYGFS